MLLLWSQTETAEPLACELSTSALQTLQLYARTCTLTPAQRQFSPFPLQTRHYLHLSHKFPRAANFPCNGTASVSLSSLQRHSAVSCLTGSNFLYNQVKVLFPRPRTEGNCHAGIVLWMISISFAKSSKVVSNSSLLSRSLNPEWGQPLHPLLVPGPRWDWEAGRDRGSGLHSHLFWLVSCSCLALLWSGAPHRRAAARRCSTGQAASCQRRL